MAIIFRHNIYHIKRVKPVQSNMLKRLKSEKNYSLLTSGGCLETSCTIKNMKLHEAIFLKFGRLIF